MITTCQPLPQSVAEETLQIVARAICDRPGDSARQREGRTRQMVHFTLGFEPRDGLEYMLASLVVGHFHLILDSMHAVLWGQMDSMKEKTKAGIVSLDRAMLSFVKELRHVRHRPVIRSAEDAQRPSEATAAPSPMELPEWVAAWAGVRPADPIVPGPIMTPAAPAQPNPGRTEAAPIELGRPQAKPAPQAAGRTPDPVQREDPPATDDLITEEHITAFKDALEAATASLAEARALDESRARKAGSD